MQHSWAGFWNSLLLGHQRASGDRDERFVRLERQTRQLRSSALEAIEPVRERRICRILAATNFSPASNYALERAVALSNQCHAVLTVLHVIDVNTQSDCSTAAEVWAQLKKEASLQMGQLVGSLCGQVDAQTVLEEGLPGDAIVRKSPDFDLIILGNGRGKSGWFSNHTVQHVLDEAACPVMVVRQLA